MKKIEATIRAYKFDEVKNSLAAAGVEGMTVSEVSEIGGRKSSTYYRGVECSIDLHPMVKLEIVVPDARVASVVRDIERAARTGKMGDGRIFVMPVADAIRIRTGERDSFAVERSTGPRPALLHEADRPRLRQVARRHGPEKLPTAITTPIPLEPRKSDAGEVRRHI